MAPIFNWPIHQPLDDSGQIMPGSYLKYFESETTTPTDVYADGALNTSRGSTVTSDSAGRFPVIYMDQTVALRVQFYNADDELQWDVDPVFPITGQFVGQVEMYDGDLNDIPAGWVHMNGSNGTIDARDRSPIGTSGTKALGTTGGSNNATTSAAGGHDHGGATSEVVLDETNMPKHGHKLLVCTTGDGATHNFQNDSGIAGDTDTKAYYTNTNADAGQKLVEETGEDDPSGHDHDIEAEEDHTHTVSVVPPWFSIHFIKFVGA